MEAISRAGRDSPNDRAAILRACMNPKDLAAADILPLPLAFPVMILSLVLIMDFRADDQARDFFSKHQKFYKPKRTQLVEIG